MKKETVERLEQVVAKISAPDQAWEVARTIAQKLMVHPDYDVKAYTDYYGDGDAYMRTISVLGPSIYILIARHNDGRVHGTIRIGRGIWTTNPRGAEV